jgi:transcription elongation factor Elf1
MGPGVRRDDMGVSRNHAIFSPPAGISGVKARKPLRRRSTGMDKKALREETERLMREALAKKSVVVKQGDTRILATCGKCGAPNKTKAPKGVARVKYTCKECGHTQATL